jgi:hypothetical protein
MECKPLLCALSDDPALRVDPAVQVTIDLSKLLHQHGKLAAAEVFVGEVLEMSRRQGLTLVHF